MDHVTYPAGKRSLPWIQGTSVTVLYGKVPDLGRPGLARLQIKNPN